MHPQYTPRHIARFWARVDRSDTCWLWIGQRAPNGYGHVSFSWGRERVIKTSAHRVSFELSNGPIPDGLSILHTCDVRACVRPEHLYAGTHAENMRDAAERSRWGHGPKDEQRARGEGHGQSKLTISQVLELRHLWAEGAVTQRALARKFDISSGTVSQIIQRRTWKTVEANPSRFEARPIVPATATPWRPTPKPLAERFWKHVNRSGECWPWTGRPCGKGYGRISLGPGQRMVLAHRASWELHFGPIPEGLFVCHQCDTRLCVRPDHLILGTAQYNQRDMHRKGRGWMTTNPEKRLWGDRNPSRLYPELRRGDRNGNAKITPAQVGDIRRLYAAGGVSQTALGEKYGLAQSHVSKIVLGQAWAHL